MPQALQSAYSSVCPGGSGEKVRHRERGMMVGGGHSARKKRRAVRAPLLLTILLRTAERGLPACPADACTGPLARTGSCCLASPEEQLCEHSKDRPPHRQPKNSIQVGARSACCRAARPRHSRCRLCLLCTCRPCCCRCHGCCCRRLLDLLIDGEQHLARIAHLPCMAAWRHAVMAMSS